MHFMSMLYVAGMNSVHGTKYQFLYVVMPSLVLTLSHFI